ncbi:MAG: uracil phosphoribosyltransferase [Muribaculaceae bacterium]|nr:uracil phosphoribosyltransferase [Muribaculaceae bacterium]
MEFINLGDQHSLVNHYMQQLRDRNIQRDRMRFRANVHRLGQIMAYEISKRLDYITIDTPTPLATAHTPIISSQVVVATILRAGLALHDGFLSYLDTAENAFVSAYRQYRPGSQEFDVHIEYLASPSIEGKTLIITDPMLATGRSMELAYRALLTRGTPSHIHVASVIASEQAIDYVKQTLPDKETTLWTCALDHELNAHSYIVPGLGDAGDLLYGEKL